MSLQPKPMPTVMRMRDEPGTIFSDEQFAALFSRRGQPAESPAALALVTVMQFAEGLSDRQAAHAVRGGIDWKYALGLELTDPALNTVATIAPDWLSSWVPADWFDRYSRRFEEFRLPDSRDARYALGEQIGRDGHQLWEQLGLSAELICLRQLPALDTLRQIWLQQYVIEEGHLRWRQGGELPPAALLIQSPYDIEARYSIKRRTTWTGYKVHLTESCDEEMPHLIVNVETTPATLTDYEMTSEIQNHLAERDLLPGEHLVDSGYMSSDNLVDSHAHKVDLIGPVAGDPSWQAQAAEGFESAAFAIDWENQVAIPRAIPVTDGLPSNRTRPPYIPSDSTRRIADPVRSEPGVRKRLIHRAA